MSIRIGKVIAVALLASLLLIGYAAGQGQGQGRGNPNNGAGGTNAKLDDILDRLTRIEDSMQENQPFVSATFCISQGRGAELAAEFAVEAGGEVKAGLGWHTVFKGKVVPSAEFPIVIPAITIPVPTEGKIEFAGGLGRGLDICIELPVELTDEDQATLDQVALDINTPQVFQESKFQRRAGRVLRYADRRIPPLRDQQVFASDAEQDMENEFDRADDAIDSLLDVGIGKVASEDGGLGVFRNGKVQELLTTLEVPFEAREFMNDPGRIFDGLPELRDGEEPMFCDDVGISGRMRGERPRLDQLCQRLEELPVFNRARNSGEELVEAVEETMANLLEVTGERRSNAKEKFCNSRIGMRPRFDTYCSEFR